MEWIWIGFSVALGIVAAVVGLILLALAAGAIWGAVSTMAEWVGLK